MSKKISILMLIVLLACVVLLTACGGKGEADELIYTHSDENFEYAILKRYDNSEYYAKITKYVGAQETSPTDVVEVIVPKEIILQETAYPIKVIGTLAFYSMNPSLVKISEGVTTIEGFAFAYCGASGVELPSTIARIDEYAFANCNSLKVVEIKAQTPPVLGDYAFKFYIEATKTYVVNTNFSIRVPKDSVEAYKSAPAWSEYKGVIANI